VVGFWEGGWELKVDMGWLDWGGRNIFERVEIDL
jgi:hypothetical protein